MSNQSQFIKRLKFMSLLSLLLLVVLTACSKDDNTGNTDDSEINRLDWDRSASSILLRVDQIATFESEAYTINALPLCTIWGDGRLVMLNYLGSTSEVLEARLSDEQIREVIENIIGFGFYSWEDDIIPVGTENPTLESISLNLFDNPKTVERYDDWPNNGFSQILQSCQGSSPTRATVIPDGGWVSAYVLDSFDNSGSLLDWPRNAPFTMEDLAGSDEARWVDGAWAHEIWDITRETGTVQILENGIAYEIAIEVPDISRTSQPAPIPE
jgi:hypothetical protein